MVGLRALQLFGPKVGGPRLLKSVRVPLERPEKKASACNNQDATLSLNHSTVHEASLRLDWDPSRCTAFAQLIRHPASAPILHSLGTMENLTALYLQECSWPETSDQIDDTFARRLAQRVTEANHFPALRTLIIEETAIQLSSKFFESLHDIPTLQLLCVKSATSVTSVWTKSYPQVHSGSPGWIHIKSYVAGSIAYLLTNRTDLHSGTMFLDRSPAQVHRTPIVWIASSNPVSRAAIPALPTLA